MSVIFKMLTALLIFTAIFSPLELNAMDDKDQAAQARDINRVLLTSRHPLMDQIRLIMDDLGRSLANLWRTILGQPLDPGNDPGPCADPLERQLFDHQRILERLNHMVKETIQDPLSETLTDAEREMLSSLHANTNEALALNTVAGGGGAATLAWFAQAAPGVIYKLKDHPRFFTGLEIPAVIGILKPVLGPIAILVTGVLVYREVKKYMTYEFEARTKDQVDELKKLVQRYHDESIKGSQAHKKEMEAVLHKVEQRMQDAVSQARHNIVNLQHEADANNKRIDDHIASVQKKFTDQLNAIVKAQRDVNEGLIKEDGEIKKKLAAEQAQLATQAQALDKATRMLEDHARDIAEQRRITTEHFKAQGSNLDQLMADVKGVSAVNKQLDDKINKEALPKLQRILHDVGALRNRTDEDLKTIDWIRVTVVPYMQHKAKSDRSIAAHLPPPPQRLLPPPVKK